MSARIHMTGRRYGRWVVGEFRGANANGQTIYSCRCDCGTERDVVAQSLRNGLTLSCGCMKPQAISFALTQHGQTTVKSINQRATKTYLAWKTMHRRCRGTITSGDKYYVRYGVKVCERWNSFANFLADMGEAPEGKSLDRYPDKDGDYEPGNCRWAARRNGSIWINDGTKSQQVLLAVAEKMLQEGWQRGLLRKSPR